MNRDQFLKETRKFAKANNLEFSIDKKRGKGSHITVCVGKNKAIVPSGEIKKGTMRGIKRQLEIN